tara:strand:+ start:1915 stop:2310 length:396 start_codon:yes stop_codon:yes gene_type:complete
MSSILWDHINMYESVADLIEGGVPAWIDQGITPCDVAAICQGGCASGAYMPAVTYWQALETMSEHGNEVLQFIEDVYGELPRVPEGESWSGIAVYFLSTAVELWASGIEGELVDAIETMEEEDEEDEEEQA